MGEDACSAFMDRFAKLSIISDHNVGDLGYNLTLLFKAFGRKLHRLLKDFRAQNHYKTIGSSPMVQPEDKDSFIKGTVPSLALGEEVPYKVKFLFKELLLHLEIRGLLATLINCEELLEQHFYFHHLLFAMMLEESSL